MVIEPLNARSLLLKYDKEDRVKFKDNTIYTKEWLDNPEAMNEGGCITLLDKLPVTLSARGLEYNSYYEVNDIKQLDESRLVVSEFILNDSSIWILPMIGSHSGIDFDFKDNYANSYLDQTVRPDVYMSNRIVLIYRYTPSMTYTITKGKLIDHPQFVNIFKSNDDRFDIYIFNLLEEYIEDYKLIIEGKYSKVSDNYRELICNAYKDSAIKTEILGIVNKTKEYRKFLSEHFHMNFPTECEYKGKFNLVKEILN